MATIFTELHLAGQLEAALQLGEQNHIAQGGQPPREGESGSAAAEEFSRLLQQLKQAVLWIRNNYFKSGSVPDPNPDPPDPRAFGLPDPDPPDPCVFWPPRSGSTSQRYESRSGSFYHQAKIVRKTLIPTVL
jgi:hypothetical protein